VFGFLSVIYVWSFNLQKYKKDLIFINACLTTNVNGQSCDSVNLLICCINLESGAEWMALWENLFFVRKYIYNYFLNCLKCCNFVIEFFVVVQKRLLTF